jgi:hypothetical protein
VTSLMLCPRADIYNSRTIGLITSAKDKLGKDEEILSLRGKKCAMLYDVSLSKNVRLYGTVFILS